MNWRLHLTLNGMVLRRSSDPSLPDAKVINDLCSRGETRLNAIHRVAEVLVHHIWRLLWLGKVQSGATRPQDVPPELRGAPLPTNEELDEKITDLLAARARPAHRQRR